jgi:hypothetical protein
VFRQDAARVILDLAERDSLETARTLKTQGKSANAAEKIEDAHHIGLPPYVVDPIGSRGTNLASNFVSDLVPFHGLSGDVAAEHVVRVSDIKFTAAFHAAQNAFVARSRVNVGLRDGHLRDESSAFRPRLDVAAVHI